MKKTVNLPTRFGYDPIFILALNGLTSGIGMQKLPGMSYSNRFWIAAGVMLLAGIVTWLGSGKAAQQIQIASEDNGDEATKDKPVNTGLGSVLFSTFGLVLLILILSSIA
ncbi:MAG: hypothetical protein GY797_26600, partial [Deltaproteobacteria bacterium]|nr:hypothetical protein [Deltaproteobacteria bacterium]